MFPYDFRDDRMMKQLKEITQRIISIYPELQTDFASLTHNLINKVSNSINDQLHPTCTLYNKKIKHNWILSLSI